MELNELYQELQEAFERYKPNDPGYLEIYPELAEEIEGLEQLEPSTTEETYEAINELQSFLTEWFPDAVEEIEQERVKGLLDEAKRMTTAFQTTKLMINF